MAGRKTLATTPPWAIMLFGVTLCGLGVFIQFTSDMPGYKAVAAVLAAVGAGTLGAGIGATVASADGHDTLSHIRKLLEGALGAGMHSDEEDLAVVKHRWHFYFLAKRENGYVWRYTDYRLDNSGTPNTAVTLIKDHVFGQDRVFRTEVAIRGDRLLLVEEDVRDRIPGLIAISHDFTRPDRAVRAGIALMNCWDGTRILTKCMWSVEPLTAYELTDGTACAEDGVALDRVWNDIFRRSTIVLPDATAPFAASEAA